MREEHKRERDSGVDRRRFVQAAGAAGLTGVAGCSSGDGNPNEDGDGGGGTNTTETTTSENNGEETTDEQSPTNVVDQTFTWMASGVGVVKNQSFNPYSIKNASTALPFMFDWMARRSQKSGEWIPLIASDWSIDDQRMTINLNSEYQWTNGDPVTAKDVATKLKLNKHMGFSIADYAAEIASKNDSTVEIKLSKSTNKDVLLLNILPIAIDTPHTLYKDKLQNFEDATTDAERKSARESLVQWKLEDPVSNGPFMDGRIPQASVYELDRFPDYPKADSINFKHFRIKDASSNQEIWQNVIASRVDGTGTTGMPKDVYNKVPDHYFAPVLVSYAGAALSFNHEHPILSKRKVRQGIAHVINREQVQKNVHFAREPVDIPSGIPGIPFDNPQKWLGDAADQYDTYPTDKEKAIQLFKEAGLKKENGSWVGPNGEVVKLELLSPGAWATWTKGSQTIVSLLNEFGLKTELTAIEVTTYQTRKQNSNFDLAYSWWGGGQPHPYFGFQFLFTKTGSADQNNYPSSVSISPVGNPSGEKTTVQLPEQVAALSTANPEQAREIVKQLAWVVNQDLPKLPLYEKVGRPMVATDDWNVTLSKDDPKLYAAWPARWLPRIGALQAKTG